MKYLLDTDHISILQRQSLPEYPTLIARIAQHSTADLAASIISFHEQVLGCHTYIARARSPQDVVRGYRMLAQVLRDFAAALVLPFDAAAAEVFASLAAQRLRVATMDLRIASIPLSRGLVLVTRNESDFARVPGLTTEDWTREGGILRCLLTQAGVRQVEGHKAGLAHTIGFGSGSAVHILTR